LSEQAFLGQYEPETNVDAIAALDLDQRSIVARLATGDRDGLAEAQIVYSNGQESSELNIKRLSTEAETDLSASPTYKTFVEYYGESDYADQWVDASYRADATSFSGNGNVEFRNFFLEGRAAAIRWGTPLLHVWVYVLGLLETAANNCQISQEAGANDEQIAIWDKAVALYTGSEARESGAHGHFIYTLAQVECYKFGTCKKEERAPVNSNIYDRFADGKRHLLNGNCDKLVGYVVEIKGLMTVPLVQGVLRAMYAMDVQDDFQETTQGMGAAFAAAVVPLVHACSEGNADLIHNDLAPGNAIKGSYEVVRHALERSYECLGIKCEDIGGLVDVRAIGYLKWAGACKGVSPVTTTGSVVYDGGNQDGEVNSNIPAQVPMQSESGSGTGSRNKIAVILGLTLGSLCFFLGFALALTCNKKKTEMARSKGNTSNETNAVDPVSVEGSIV